MRNHEDSETHFLWQKKTHSEKVSTMAWSGLRERVDLTEEEIMEVNTLLSVDLSGPVDHIIVIDKFQIDMIIKKLACLQPQTWLNDEVINFYTNMMVQETMQSAGGERIYSFSTFFMERVYQNRQYNFPNVQRWTKKVDIFGQKKVFIPINISNRHWVLVLIDLTVKTIFFYDGFEANGDPYVTLTLQVLLTTITLQLIWNLSKLL